MLWDVKTKTEMREERVTYSEVRVHSSSQQQKRTPENSETKKAVYFEHLGNSALPISWKIILVVLCIICLVLLLSVGILATKLMEQNSGNLTSNQETVQKGLISGILTLPTSTQDWKYHPCEDNWYQYGEHCYSFTRNMVPWEECNLRCSTLLSSFLKLNTEKEMDFVIKLSEMQCQMHQEKFWISLYYNSSQLKWSWLDGSAFTLNKFQLKIPDKAYNHCQCIKNGQLCDDNCKEHGYCICKKTIYGD
ncbi:C-type lectin domain family 7 member A-like isoform X1 [Saccopteryx bilineata]|uniref:C-type lectin domain family 7 member A-like isoform X1 n=2 Tax=Saccopteryx bilineata TaxID=59482 RepID=UPI00338FA513